MSPSSKRTGYDPDKFVPFLRRLMEERNESYRETSLNAGLDRSAMWRFLNRKNRPHRDACILLAQHFEVNPNEMLQMAGYDPLPLFDLSLTDASEYPPEVKAVAQALTEITDLALRRRACELVREVIDLIAGTGSTE